MSSTPPLGHLYTSHAPPELRAKRTHARRSCDVCKIRKTRCELPDLEIPAGPNPLPIDKSCHRCKILAIPCIVDDQNKRGKKRQIEDPSSSSSQQQQQTTRKAKSRSSVSGHMASQYQKEGELAVQASPTWDLEQSEMVEMINSQGVPMTVEEREIAQNRRMKKSGRPLELVSAMLGVAYGAKGGKNVEEYSEIDLLRVVDTVLIAKLEPGLAKLRTFHPYLETFQSMVSSYRSDPASASALLLSLVIYLSSLVLPYDKDLSDLRTTLTPYIISLRNELIVQLPESFIAIQALEILALHAPLGVLPLQMANLKSIAPARGQVVAAVSISNTIRFPDMIQRMRQLGKIPDSTSLMGWEAGDIWLWLDLCVAEAALSLEGESVVKPASLAVANEMVEEFFSGGPRGVWAAGLRSASPPEFVGRLATCDRIARLSLVIDIYQTVRSCFEDKLSDFSFDIVGAMSSEISSLARGVQEIDAKHDAILAMISPISNGVESGWLAYRRLRVRHEMNKVYVYCVRAFIATAYYPGHPLAFPGLPEMTPRQKMAYAVARATTPSDVLSVIMRPDNAATQALWTFGVEQETSTGETLASFNQVSLPGELIPLHDCFSMVVDSVKSKVETQACKDAIRKKANAPYSEETLTVPEWVYVIRQLSDTMRNVASLSVLPKGGGAVESIANGCAELIGSMVRMVEEWQRENRVRMEREQLSAQSDLTSTGPTPTLNDAINDYTPTNSTSGGQHTPHQDVNREYGYMSTSDRWMASDHPPQPHGHNAGPHPLDLLLSHMFNYSYQPHLPTPHMSEMPQQQMIYPTNQAEIKMDNGQHVWAAGDPHGQFYS